MDDDRFPAPRVFWHTATASANAGGQCVQAGPIDDGSGRVAVRHSKHPDGTAIVFTQGEWAAFVDGVQKGEFDFHHQAG